MCIIPQEKMMSRGLCCEIQNNSDANHTFKGDNGDRDNCHSALPLAFFDILWCVCVCFVDISKWLCHFNRHLILNKIEKLLQPPIPTHLILQSIQSSFSPFIIYFSLCSNTLLLQFSYIRLDHRYEFLLGLHLLEYVRVVLL